MPESAARTMDIDNVDYRLKSIALDDLHLTTTSFVFPHPKKIQLAFTVGEAEDYPLMRLTTVRVELGTSEEEVLATIESCFKVTFVSELEGAELDALEDEFSQVATRISYPYHRQLISDLVTRMGLRPTFLPVVHDGMWDRGADKAEDGDEAEAVAAT